MINVIKKTINNSNGYALLLTFGILIIFTVLGLSLMTLTMNGTTKSSSLEDNTQALNLAEKGTDFIINEINTSLSYFTKHGKFRDEFIAELEKYNQNNPRYKCTFDSNGNLINGLEILTSNDPNNSSLACIKNAHPVYDEKGLNALKKKLELISFGEVDGKKKHLTSFVEIGADHIPEQLKYAVTSKGNVHLNGAVQITGDLRFDGSLSTYNKAHIINGRHYWVDSLKPSIKSSSSRSNPRIVVGENSNFYSVKDVGEADDRYTGIHNLRNSYLKTEPDISTLFDTSVFDKVPTIITTDSDINNVDISLKKNTYFYSKSDANNIIAENNGYRGSNYYIKPGTYNYKGYLVTELECDSRGRNCDYPILNTNNSFNLQGGNYTFKKLATNASLNISGTTNNPSKVTIEDTLYVNGDLTINGNVELSGSIFVNGRLIIKNSNFKTNALIYVNSTSSSPESVDIEYSTINSLPYRNEKNEPTNGTLVIFSKGKVKLSNNSSWSDSPSEIYGYFYSDKELEIYGSGSNMKIHGGVYGNRITLHGIRGKSSDHPFTDSNEYNRWYFLKSDKQDDFTTKNANELQGDLRCNYPGKNNTKKCYTNNSRLQIHYNEDVITTYIELNRQEELVYKVDPPKFVERQ